jgi:hypothetical protein
MAWDAADLLNKPTASTESIDEPADGCGESLRLEIFRRLQQIDSGAVELIPWEDAERRLWSKLRS